MTLVLTDCSSDSSSTTIRLDQLQYKYSADALQIIQRNIDRSGQVYFYGNVSWDLDSDSIDLFLEPCGGFSNSSRGRFRPRIKLETQGFNDLQSQLLKIFSDGHCIIVKGKFVEGNGTLAEGGRLGELQDVEVMQVID